MFRNGWRFIYMACALFCTTAAMAQDSGTLVLSAFLPGSADIGDPSINAASLARVDSLLSDKSIDVIFIGAADSLRWKVHSRPVHRYVSDALDNATRLGRARTLRARYGRGSVGVTDENLAGVKVVWSRRTAPLNERLEFEKLLEQNRELNSALDDLRREVDALRNARSGSEVHEIAYTQSAGFNWQLQTGLWSWLGGRHGNLLTPSLGLNIVHGRLAMDLRAGVTPWNYATDNGKEAESIVYLGMKYRRPLSLGISAGVFRGWRFFAESDNWSMKTTGAALGLLFSYRVIEFNPMLTYAEVASYRNDSSRQVGGALNVSLNLN